MGRLNRVDPVGKNFLPQKCYLCVRNEPEKIGSDGWNRTTDLGVMKAQTVEPTYPPLPQLPTKT